MAGRARCDHQGPRVHHGRCTRSAGVLRWLAASSSATIGPCARSPGSTTFPMHSPRLVACACIRSTASWRSTHDPRYRNRCLHPPPPIRQPATRSTRMGRADPLQHMGCLDLRKRCGAPSSRIVRGRRHLLDPGLRFTRCSFLHGLRACLVWVPRPRRLALIFGLFACRLCRLIYPIFPILFLYFVQKHCWIIGKRVKVDDRDDNFIRVSTYSAKSRTPRTILTSFRFPPSDGVFRTTISPFGTTLKMSSANRIFETAKIPASLHHET